MTPADQPESLRLAHRPESWDRGLVAPARSAAPAAIDPTVDPFAGSTLTCTGTPYAADPCNCMYHVLTRAFAPTPRTRKLRAFSPKRIYRNTTKPNQKETLI